MSSISIPVRNDVLHITIINSSILRIQRFYRENSDPQPILKTGNNAAFHDWSVKQSSDAVELLTEKLRVIIRLDNGCITYYTRISNEEILSEIGATADPAACETAMFAVEQFFATRKDEQIGGFGQQADGAVRYNGRFVHLNQFNIISAVPMLVSTGGYGVLWNNCSLTEINRNKTPLLLKMCPYSKTSSGSFIVPEDGEYAFVLEKTNKNLGYEDIQLTVGNETVIERGTGWHANWYTGTVHLRAGQEYPIFLNGSANVYVQMPSQQQQTSIWSEFSHGIDYFFLYGPEADQIISHYRALTGDAPMFPRWTCGYWQSKEHYQTGRELMEVVQEHRRRGYPLDAIVQDWQYWKEYGWNALRFSNQYDPHIEETIQALHDQNVQLMISVWPNFDDNEKNEAYHEFRQKGYLMDDSALKGLGSYTAAMQGFRKNYYDVWNPRARSALWTRMEENLYRKGVDAWWLDASEPNLWSIQGAYHMYNTCRGPAAEYLNAYPLLHCQGVYEGQRASDENKRVFLLSRTAFAGIQRYSAATWSGDTWGSWQVFRRQIADGLQYCLSGLPYWHTDIGGFRGESVDSANYRELYVRWFEYGTFTPLMRAHGTNIPREVWQFGPAVEKILHKYLKLRYNLLDYIYSLNWDVTHRRGTIMRCLWMDHRADRNTWSICDQYMFGSCLMVCPVTQPGVSNRRVYLPQGSGWFDFWTNQYIPGGSTIDAKASLDTIPLYAKQGSILPFGREDVLHSGQQQTLELRVYSGENACFVLYRDSGDGYAYEQGEYAETVLEWTQQTHTLTMHNQSGTFAAPPLACYVRVFEPDGTILNSELYCYAGLRLDIQV